MVYGDFLRQKRNDKVDTAIHAIENPIGVLELSTVCSGNVQIGDYFFVPDRPSHCVDKMG
jgi:hypothetical protein